MTFILIVMTIEGIARSKVQNTISNSRRSN